ncbi:tRNA (5-methylaminomethyl-2-thiouridine)(34)-methyltransferase MnmD [Thermocoleostomius sinensis]|uniref:MnmC family methyltransferase n=1 Tax=Thermocoleostomius sinensis A174 TaxID=2016057 RepID=A0A9E8ZBA6_9CYAN|nr:MnmC family methyltransferase [Thermocoleostomius sinensis]WAL58110.1 MnmC family methyltransferase [Thermocoleostomius sinensis A174]
MKQAHTWIPQVTQDGSFTFFSEEFGETFHSQQGARAEAFTKFVHATQLVQKAKHDRLRLLDICYGLGYNTAAALETIWQINPACQIEMYGLELDATVPRAAIEPRLIERWSLQVQAVLTAIAINHQYQQSGLTAQLIIGDARQTIQMLCQSRFQADAIFFDPFSPRRCPQLWTVEFFQQVSQCLAADGRLATYSRSASVRSAMLAAGFSIGTIPVKESHLPHEWSQGTVATFDASSLQPLSQLEQEHLQTRAAIPYRDPSLSDSAEVISARHQQEQQQSQRESTSSWRRRWGIV